MNIPVYYVRNLSGHQAFSYKLTPDNGHCRTIKDPTEDSAVGLNHILFDQNWLFYTEIVCSFLTGILARRAEVL